MTFEKWMTKTFDEPEWDEGWNRVEMAMAWDAGEDSRLEEMDGLWLRIRELEAKVENA